MTIPDDIARRAATYANETNRMSGEASDVDDIIKAVDGMRLGQWGDHVRAFVAGATWQREQTRLDPHHVDERGVCTTSTPGPVAPPSKDVDALLREADAWADWQEGTPGVLVATRHGSYIMRDIAAALREAQERASAWQRAGEANDACAHEATRHLHAVLDTHMPIIAVWQTGLAANIAARAFLAGQDAPSDSAGVKVPAEQPAAPRGVHGPLCTCPATSEYDPPCPRHGVVAIGVTPRETADDVVALRAERDALRAEVENWKATSMLDTHALAAEKRAHDATREELEAERAERDRLAKAERKHMADVVAGWQAACDGLRADLAAEKAGHEATRKDLAKVRADFSAVEAQLATEDEAHAVTRQQLAHARHELEGEREAWRVARRALADVGEVLGATGGESPLDAARRVRSDLDALRAGIDELAARCKR